jgi:uncharacterized DUF497 family protein/predicted DNA binding CopG/RHH family protein
VAFTAARIAFYDRNRVIAEDSAHSCRENRFYCFGRVGEGILTVRFTYRRNRIRIIGAGYWRKGKALYEKKTRYTDEPLGQLRVVKDFLPSPEELAFKEDAVKVTMTLSRSSVEYFKKAAQKYHTPYQKMIRKLIDAYAARHPLP